MNIVPPSSGSIGGLGIARVRILIVDDDEEFCREFRDMLVNCGYVAEYCCDPDLVLDAEEQFCPDAVFIDLWLRGQDGLHVAWQLTMANEVVQLFVMSGDHHRLRCAVRERSCVTGFLEKPFDRMTVSALLRSQRSA